MFIPADCIILLPPVISPLSLISLACGEIAVGADQGYVAREEMREYYDIRESSIK